MFLNKKHDLFTSGASHMCMVPNSIFRGYNSIYHQAPHVSKIDKADLVGYCLVWHKFLKTHADNEDTSLFPRTEELLDDKSIFKESHVEHDDFMPGIANFKEYLASLPSPSEFSGAEILEIMATFQEPIEFHMRSEVSTIANLRNHARTPKEGSAEEDTTRTAFNTREGNNIVKSGMIDVQPFFLYNFDSEYEGGLWKDWPPIPAPVRWMFTSVARVMHPGWWKFASCDSSRQRR